MEFEVFGYCLFLRRFDFSRKAGEAGELEALPEKRETSGNEADSGILRKGKQRLCLELVPRKMANSIGVDEALSYKECSVSFQKVEGEKFIQLDVSPQMQAGDAILDLGCGTGQLSAQQYPTTIF